MGTDRDCLREQLAALVPPAQAGCGTSLNELLRQSRPFICRNFTRGSSRYSDADDLTQEVMIRVVDKLGTLRNPDAYLAWLHRMCVNIGIAKRTAPAITRYHPVDPVCMDRNELLGVTTEDRDRVDLIKKMVQEAVAELPEYLQPLADSYYWKRVPVKELAIQYTVPLGTIKRRLYTIRRRLRKLLKEQVDTLLGAEPGVKLTPYNDRVSAGVCIECGACKAKEGRKCCAQCLRREIGQRARAKTFNTNISRVSR